MRPDRRRVRLAGRRPAGRSSRLARLRQCARAGLPATCSQRQKSRASTRVARSHATPAAHQRTGTSAAAPAHTSEALTQPSQPPEDPGNTQQQPPPPPRPDQAAGKAHTAHPWPPAGPTGPPPVPPDPAPDRHRRSWPQNLPPEPATPPLNCRNSPTSSVNRSSRTTVDRPTPAFPASSAADRPCWRRNCPSRAPSTTANQRPGERVGLGVRVMVAHLRGDELGRVSRW